LTVDFPDGIALHLVYRTRWFTSRKAQAINAARRQGDMSAGIADPLCALIESWDLLGDDDHPLPITPDTMLDLPEAIVVALERAIMRDIRRCHPLARRTATKATRIRMRPGDPSPMTHTPRTE